MNYIGSKNKLSPWIFEIIQSQYEKDLKDAVFADLFSGTGQVARFFKPHVKKIIANDFEKYSYVLNKHYIGNTTNITQPNISATPETGIITDHFSPHSEHNRMYYTIENAMLIDGFRNSIENLFNARKINEGQYYWALCSLVEAADKVANTASVYGAFLKKFKKTALKKLHFELVEHIVTNQNNEVYQQDANQLIHNIKGDILYLDPPYNSRQYGANYHVLNRIVENKSFSSDKVTGLADYNKSEYCKKNKAEEVFEDLIKNADFPFIFISYNNEGLIDEDTFKSILKKYGDYSLFLQSYKRFKADSNRYNKTTFTYEHLHCLEKK